MGYAPEPADDLDLHASPPHPHSPNRRARHAFRPAGRCSETEPAWVCCARYAFRLSDCQVVSERETGSLIVEAGAAGSPKRMTARDDGSVGGCPRPRFEAAAQPGTDRRGSPRAGIGLDDGPAAGHRDRGAAHVAGLVGGEQHVDRRELGGLGGASKRRVATEALNLLGRDVEGISGVQTGPGSTRVDADAAFAERAARARR